MGGSGSGCAGLVAASTTDEAAHTTAMLAQKTAPRIVAVYPLAFPPGVPTRLTILGSRLRGANTFVSVRRGTTAVCESPCEGAGDGFAGLERVVMVVTAVDPGAFAVQIVRGATASSAWPVLVTADVATRCSFKALPKILAPHMRAVLFAANGCLDANAHHGGNDAETTGGAIAAIAACVRRMGCGALSSRLEKHNTERFNVAMQATLAVSVDALYVPWSIAYMAAAFFRLYRKSDYFDTASAVHNEALFVFHFACEAACVVAFILCTRAPARWYHARRENIILIFRVVRASFIFVTALHYVGQGVCLQDATNVWIRSLVGVMLMGLFHGARPSIIAANNAAHVVGSLYFTLSAPCAERYAAQYDAWMFPAFVVGVNTVVFSCFYGIYAWLRYRTWLRYMGLEESSGKVVAAARRDTANAVKKVS